LKFYASVRIEVRRADAIKKGTDIIGNKVNVKVVKNKVAPPFKTAALEIYYGKGISKDAEIVDMATDFDILHRSGSWYEYNGEKIGQGRETAIAYIAANPVVFTELVNKVKEKMGMNS